MFAAIRIPKIVAAPPTTLKKPFAAIRASSKTESKRDQRRSKYRTEDNPEKDLKYCPRGIFDIFTKHPADRKKAKRDNTE